jgi:hypothetical protein
MGNLVRQDPVTRVFEVFPTETGARKKRQKEKDKADHES